MSALSSATYSGVVYDLYGWVVRTCTLVAMVWSDSSLWQVGIGMRDASRGMDGM